MSNWGDFTDDDLFFLSETIERENQSEKQDLLSTNSVVSNFPSDSMPSFSNGRKLDNHSVSQTADSIVSHNKSRTEPKAKEIKAEIRNTTQNTDSQAITTTPSMPSGRENRSVIYVPDSPEHMKKSQTKPQNKRPPVISRTSLPITLASYDN